MKKNLKMSKEKRSMFSVPLGELIPGTRAETIPIVIERVKKFSHLNIKIHVVGDIVAQDFLSNSYLSKFIHTCIIDEKTQRKKIDLFSPTIFDATIEIENPAGTIQKKAWILIKSAIESKKRNLIKITEGEEDLLILPLISELPLEEGQVHLVFYGQPPITDAKTPIPEGIVMVVVDKRIKKTVQKFLKLMDKF